MTHSNPLPTITTYCNHCGRETEQFEDGTCTECLMQGKSVFVWEKKEKRK